MTFQPGNQLGATRPKFVRDSLIQSLKALGSDEQANWRKLRKITDKLVAMAEKGDTGAIREVFDRLDGRVPQAIVADDDGSPMVLQVVRYVVEPSQVIDVTPDSAPVLSSTVQSDDGPSSNPSDISDT